MSRTVIFDLDGTLVDTAPDLCAALNAVLTAAGRPELAVEDVRSLMGEGAVALIRRGFEVTGAALGKAGLPAARSAFLDHYGANLARESRPFPGALDALAALSATACRLGVCTNKPEALSRRLLKATALDRYFGAVLGGDSLAVRKPDPLHLCATIEAVGGDAADAVMVGDSAVDVATARNAAIPVIVAAYGYAGVPALSLGGDAVIESLDALPATLARLR